VLSLQVGDVVLSCAIDPSARTVRLLSLSRALPTWPFTPKR
jgi:hypothetical protein